jgi:enterochelin esterase-like enzyme
MTSKQMEMLSGIPAVSNNPNAEFPRIQPDGQVTFRITADTASKVEVRSTHQKEKDNGICRFGVRYEMTRDENGFWTVTTPPILPGFYHYEIVVDGAAMNDPGSRTSFAGDKEISYIEVPEPGSTFCDPQNVPHGEVRQHWYYSKLTKAWRRAFVYTPPEYDKALKVRYPVLYLQHGGTQNETSWVTAGRANFILDNLIAAKQAVPMIVVMDNGSTFSPGISRLPDPPPPDNLFEKVMINEIIPMTDATYRTLADQKHRAMAGLSMGSHQTLQITLAHLDTFSHIGPFSPAPMPFEVKTFYGGVLANASEFNKKARLFYLAVGTAEEGIHKSMQKILFQLDRVGIKYTYKEWPGLIHEWWLWRKCLHDFVPRLFR